MGTVRRLAEEVGRGLQAALPTLCKTVVDKVALAVGAVIEQWQAPNTAELANVLPLVTERQDMREQWRRRLLKDPLLSGAACGNGQTVILDLFRNLFCGIPK